WWVANRRTPPAVSARSPRRIRTPPQKKTASSPPSFSKQVSSLPKPDKPIPASITRLYSNDNFEAFGLLCFGVHDWSIGEAANASVIFTSFLSAKLPDSQSWINELKLMAADDAFDCYLVAEIGKDLLAISDAK